MANPTVPTLRQKLRKALSHGQSIVTRLRETSQGDVYDVMHGVDDSPDREVISELEILRANGVAQSTTQVHPFDTSEWMTIWHAATKR
jgi:hypothetical protein